MAVYRDVQRVRIELYAYSDPVPVGTLAVLVLGHVGSGHGDGSAADADRVVSGGDVRHRRVVDHRCGVDLDGCGKSHCGQHADDHDERQHDADDPVYVLLH